MPAFKLSVFEPNGAPPFRSDCATVQHVIDWYRTNNPLKSKSIKADRERARLCRLFSAEHGHRLCSDCHPYDLLAFVNQRAGDNAWTRKRWNGTLQRPFNFAANLGLIDKNPFHGLTFADGENGRDWTDAEYAALLRCAKPHLRRLIVCIRFSGMRPGEIRELIWPSVKPLAGAIIIEEHKTIAKTKIPRRIPLNHVLIKLFAWLRRETPASSPRLFLNSFGRPWTMRALGDAIVAARTRAKLPSDVKLHGGRHTFATHAIMNGIDVGTLAQLLGHTKIGTTQRYMHLAGKVDHLNEAMEKAIQKCKKTCLPL